VEGESVIRGVLKTIGYFVGLSLLMGLAIVQSSSYLQNYVTHSGSPVAMYGMALLVGLALGLVTERFSLLLFTPIIVILVGALIFFVVAYSPVWTGNALGNVSIVNDLTRQVILVVFINLIPAYFGAFTGGLITQMRQ
jgi:hypothetical protein